MESGPPISAQPHKAFWLSSVGSESYVEQVTGAEVWKAGEAGRSAGFLDE